MSNFVVYKHQSPSGKVYIGITSMKPEERWKGGWGYSSQAFYRAIQKYGWNNFTHEILFSGLSQKDACEMEQKLIAYYDSTNPKYGYNMTTGGEHYTQSEQSRIKLKMSLTKYYRKHPEAKEAISQRQIGRTSSIESNTKRSKSMKAYLASHPDAQKARGDAIRGKKRSESTKQLMSERSSRARAVVCVESGKMYRSTSEAARELLLSNTGITNVLNGRSKTSGGFHWIYAD